MIQQLYLNFINHLELLTDDDWTFINHGAFGATLSPLLHESNSWRFKCESQPLRFHDRYLLPMIALTVRETANFLNCPPHELVPLPNVTSGKFSFLFDRALLARAIIHHTTSLLV